MAEWDEQGEWSYLTVTHSPLVEQLRERFDHMEIQGSEQEGLAGKRVH